MKSAHPHTPFAPSHEMGGDAQASAFVLLHIALTEHSGRSRSLGVPQVLWSGAKSQRIAVWRLLYRLQHSGQYSSRLQTDWLTHDVASVSMFDSGIPRMAIIAIRAERSAARA